MLNYQNTKIKGYTRYYDSSNTISRVRQRSSRRSSGLSQGTNAGITEPQGNQRDYLLENYDVKKAKDLKKSKLKKYDLSGPTTQESQK